MDDLSSRIAGLTADKRALLAKWLQKRERGDAPLPEIPPRQDRASWPLSFAQERLWFLQRWAPGSGFYNGHAALRVTGPLLPAALGAAVNEVFRRHEVLRATFSEVAGQPVQFVSPLAPPYLGHIDLSGLPPERREEEGTRLSAEEAERPFDLEREPMLRALLVRRSAGDHSLLLTMHHIATDGWSWGVLLREIATLYRCRESRLPSPLPELPIQYADYAAWQRERLQGETLQREIARWREALRGIPPTLELPADRIRPAMPALRGASESLVVPGAAVERLLALNRQPGLTPFMILLAAFQGLLGRITGQNDVVVGTPVAGRQQAATHDLIGVFINLLALRVKLADDPLFPVLLDRLQRTAIEAYAHQDLPFEKLVEELRPSRDVGRHPLFQVLFVFQEAPQELPAIPGLQLSGQEAESTTARYDWSLTLTYGAQGLAGSLDYATDLFDRATVQRFLGHFSVWLAALAEDPERRISELPVLTPAEHRQLVLWNATPVPRPPAATLQELLAEQAAREPGAVAVVFEGEHLTYGELADRASRLAAQLRRLGVGPEVRAGICAERSPELVVGLLAILQAGGAYVPLEPSYPAERLAFLLADSRVPVLLIQERLRPLLGDLSGVAVLGLDAPGPAQATGPEPPAERAGPDNLAYVIYTSGSTGRPKGAMNTGRAIVNRLLWMQEAYGLTPDDRVLQKTPFSFDVSVWEFFWPLLVGARLVLARPEGHKDPDYLVRLIRTEGVTTLHFVPSMLQAFLAAADVEECRSLRRVVASGEALPPDLVGRFFARLGHLGVELHNLYGPTEAAVDVTAYACRPGDELRPVPIGRPIANCTLHILDAFGCQAPVGVAGELLLGGVQLARGYLGRPELTAERFVPDPIGMEPGARLYRTGDLARYRPDGAVEFLGRLDHQVKIRGFRIELPEIELALAAHPDVREAVVVARGQGLDQRLVAYVVPAGDGEVTAGGLRGFLSERLPEHMVPASWVVLPALPLSPNGKVDRAALPAPEASGGRSRLPGTPTEELIAGIWCEVLGLEIVGAEESFFDLGGHSLLATQVVARLRDAFGAEMPLHRFFQAPTVAEQAAFVAAASRVEGADAAILPVPHQGRAPLSFAQERLWFIHQLEPATPAYNLPVALRIRGRLDEAVLAGCFAGIVCRHETLRTTFTLEKEGAVQQIAPPEPGNGGAGLLPAADLSGLPAAVREAEVGRLAGEEAARPFDLATGPLLRLALLRLGESERVLLLTMHHIVSDGWSMGLLVEETTALYPALAAGRPNPLSPLPIQYADFAVWQRGRLRGEALAAQLGWWREQLAGAPLVLALPTDRPRPPVQTFRGATRERSIPASTAGRLRSLARQESATLFMVLLAVLAELLRRFSGQHDLVIGVPIANRTRPELEKLIGFFVNALALRVGLANDPALRGLVAQARRTALDAYAHQDLPFERLVEELQLPRDLSRHPVFQVVLALQNAPVRSRQLPGLELRAEDVAGRTAKFEWTLFLEEHEGGLSAVLEYDRDLFDAATADRVLGHFERLLAAAGEPERRLSSVQSLAAEERQQLLAEWNDTAAPPPSAPWAHDQVFRRAAEDPAAPALVCAGESVSYGELVVRARRLAGFLQRRGVGSEVVVGLCLERSVDLIVAKLATLHAGGAYLPLDPSHPGDRLRSLLEDARCRLLLTHRGIDPGWEGLRLCLDLDEERIEREGGEVAPVPCAAGNLAYVIYTSGSTGRPKGVAVCHAGLANLIAWHRTVYPSGPGDRASQLASPAFDASVWEIWPPLAGGATLHIPDSEVRVSAPRLASWLADEGITCAFAPTPITEGLLREDWSASCRLQVLLTGGDTLHLRPPAGLGFRLVNHYGPTESSVVATAGLVPPGTADQPPPIGKPIANVQVHVADRGLELVPPGAAGELLIGGAGLARGYLHRPDLTAERFIPDPWNTAPGARLYRTGDLVRWLPTGELLFLGRTDRQVKVRGVRIEPGEVEAVLLSHTAIREAAVVLCAEPAGGHSLVAYVVPEGESLATGAVQEFLRSRLPPHMVPTAVVPLEALPLTPNGKVDHGALAALERPAAGSDGAGISGDLIEELLAGVWAEVLRLPRVGPRDNFFALGGHSLLATQAVSRIRSVLGVELSLREFFEAPALAELARNLRAARREGPVLPSITPAPRHVPLPLSFAQQRLWFLAQLEPHSAVYNMPVALQLDGPLRAKLLAAALSEVARRHEVLRTVFASVDGEPVQEILPAAPRPLPLVDLRALLEARRQRAAQDLAAAEAERPFDLARGPVLRATLLRLGEASHALLFTLHHIAGDGWSLGVLVAEVAELYRALIAGEAPRLPSLPVQYADYSVWQRSWLQGETLERELAWWREQLASLPPLLELPADRPRPPVQSFRGGQHPVSLTPELTGALRGLARSHGATLFMALLAGFQALLVRLGAQERLAVGTPIAGRTRLELEPLIGCFINTLVLPADLSGSPGFGDLLGRSRETSLGAHAHQDVPFERLVEELAPARSLAHAPLFQVMLVLQNTPDVSLDLPDLRLRPLGGAGVTSKFDLSLTLWEEDGGLAGTLTYAADLFDADTMDRFAGALERLLDSAVDDPSRRFSELHLLSPVEWRQLVSGSSPGDGPAAPGLCIHELFAEQVKRNPEALAVIGEDGALSYRALGLRAGRLAARLRAAGVGPDQPVILCAERGASLVVGLLGILESGGAYLAVEPDLPAARLELLAEDSRAAVAVTQRPLAGALPAGLRRVFLEDLEEDADMPEAPRAAVLPGHLAYVLYTSGSTGRPKGVQVEHRHLAAYVQGVLARLALPARASFAIVSSFAADLGNTSIFAALLNGGCLHVAARERLADAAALAEWMEHNPVDGLKIVPSHLAALLTAERPERLLPRRVLVMGGEALSASLVERVRGLAPECRIFNHYGPTETTVGVLAGEVGELGNRLNAPLGRPLGLTRAWVVDRCQQLLPAGIPGELCIGGPQVTRGYLGRPDLTAERFLPDPFGGTGERLYRTGDLVRRRPDGVIEFLGRIDDQVKIRGFRIELAEVEAALLALGGVREAAALVRQRDEDLSLAAFVAAETPVAASALLSALRSQLPAALVPSELAFVDTLPRTANGKVDRRALAALAAGLQSERTADVTEDGDAADPVAQLIADLWAEVLELPRVRPQDDFFALGGHSLLATRVLSRMREAFSVGLPLRSLFETGTPRGLAALVREARHGEADHQAPPLVPVPRGEDLPLSFAQQRLWFLAQAEPDGATYNIPIAVRLRGPLKVPALVAALRAVEQRHEVLRTTFALAEGRPVQRIGAAPRLEVPVVDLLALSDSVRGEELARLIRAEALRPFDLAAGPVWRVGLVRLGEQEHAALMTLHHIASDGWSRWVLLRELGEGYGSLARGETPSLPALPVQYADFAVWQRSWLQGETLQEQLDYWQRQLAGAPRSLEMPTDHPRPSLQSFRGASRPVALSPALSRDTVALCRQAGVTPFMALLTAWAVLLGRHAGQDDVLVGSPIAGRNRREVEGLIGCFLNTLVLRIRFAGEMTYGELLGHVRETALDAYTHQDIPFERLVEELVTERDPAISPLFQTLFVLQNAPTGMLRGSGLALELMEMASEVAKFDLSLALAEGPNGIEGTLDYNTDLFEDGTAGRLVARLAALLEGAVADPGQPVGDLPLLLPEERVELLAWSDNGPAPLSGLCLHELFFLQADRTPGAVALVDGTVRWTYAELAARAGGIAHRLRALGVGPEVRVAVCLERSADLVAALLGILAAGGAYVPIDPVYPRERRAFMMQDSGALALVTRGALAADLPVTTVNRLDLDVEEIAPAAGLPEGSGAGPDNLAYIIYTSGSTGRPKGVAIEHRSAVALAGWARAEFSDEELSGMLASTSVCFDISVFEIFIPLAWGGRVILAENALALPTLPAVDEVRLVDTVPSAAAELVRAGALPAGVRTVGLAGEPLAAALVDRVYAAGDGVDRVLNFYGPTEDTTYSTTALVPQASERAPAIGRVLPGTRGWVVDPRGRLVPAGVAGELWLAGAGLSRGYLGRPDLTAERFTPDPFGGPGERVYRTGDRVRFRPDGELEFLGRGDYQVKIRGFRIELGEIEDALCRDPRVRDAVVVVREDRPGDRSLVAYVEAVSEPPAAGDLEAVLRERLPAYMVPAAFVFLERLPLNPNGKVDRRALSASGQAPRYGPQGGRVDPRDARELALVRLWEEVLGVQPLGVRDDFFDLGGHSLLAVRLLARIKEELGETVPLVHFFEGRTVERMAAFLHHNDRDATDREATSLRVVLQPGEGPPLFWVHPAGGSVFCYLELLRHLPGWCSHGFMARGVADPEPPVSSIGEMADLYLRELRAVQPDGPYRLLGWSLGGLVALEMAQRLCAQGAEVAFLGLLDARAMAPAPDAFDEAALLRGFALDLGLPQDRLDGAAADGSEALLTRLLDDARGAGLVPTDFGLAEARRRFEVFRAHVAAGAAYRPQAYSGPITLFRAAGAPAGDREPDLGWGRIAKGGLTVHDVPGMHYTLVREPHARTLAQHIAESLRS